MYFYLEKETIVSSKFLNLFDVQNADQHFVKRSHECFLEFFSLQEVNNTFMSLSQEEIIWVYAFK